MARKYFVFSDVHSFYAEFIEALEKAGYDENNEDHWLIGLGDFFDRGSESQEMLDFLNSHTERTVLVKGNHELLMEEMLARKYYMSHDMSNGTVRTVLDLGGVKDYEISGRWVSGITAEEFEEACRVTRKKLQPIYDRMVNYYEVGKYVFVHSWIPYNYVADPENHIEGVSDYLQPHMKVYNEDWRDAYDHEWEDAMWCNPFIMNNVGLNKTGKTIVFGHFHTSKGHAIKKYKEFEDNLEYVDFDELEWGKYANFDIYYDEGVIGIDGCIAHSKQCNILVLEDIDG